MLWLRDAADMDAMTAKQDLWRDSVRSVFKQLYFKKGILPLIEWWSLYLSSPADFGKYAYCDVIFTAEES